MFAPLGLSVLASRVKGLDSLYHDSLSRSALVSLKYDFISGFYLPCKSGTGSSQGITSSQAFSVLSKCRISFLIRTGP